MGLHSDSSSQKVSFYLTFLKILHHSSSLYKAITKQYKADLIENIIKFIISISMTLKDKNPEIIQQEYYKKTANNYDTMHGVDVYHNDHAFALFQLLGLLDYLKINSILDIGSGTGRAIKFFNDKKKGIKIVGIEPVQELREKGYKKGISKNQLINGDALNIDFPENSFDLVCEFGVLHHIKNNKKVVNEMLRVSKKAIFISDCNNFGQGSFFTRSIKQFINFCNLWKLVDFIKTKGKGYNISEGDGLAYSYSVFNNYSQIKKKCKSVHLFNTRDSNENLYKTSSHVTLLGIK